MKNIKKCRGVSLINIILVILIIIVLVFLGYILISSDIFFDKDEREAYVEIFTDWVGHISRRR